MAIEPFFTILTASLNSDKTLEKTLRSVAEQNYNNLEHIVIDGGSSDHTLDLLRKYQNTYPLHWVSELDTGIANALNKGLRLARGRYLLVLQADDCLIGMKVLDAVQSLIRIENSDIYSFPVLRDDPNGRMTPYIPVKLLWWHHFKTIFPHQGAFVHRRVFERVGGFREELKIAFDYDFFYRALQAGCTVKFGQPQVAVMGAGGISSNQALLTLRLKEEAHVQSLNEKNHLWRVAQAFFRTLYVPYKTLLVPYWSTHASPRSKPERRMQDGRSQGR